MEEHIRRVVGLWREMETTVDSAYDQCSEAFKCQPYYCMAEKVDTIIQI